MKNRFLLCIMILIAVCSSLNAATIRVPQDQLTIQAGIDAAVNGDTVLVDDGTYTGAGNVNLNFFGKAITVKSVNGVATTIIDCESQNNTRAFRFGSGETSTSVLNGFTIRNGNAPDGGGILILSSSSPTITNCIISDNTSTGSGGGIFCHSSSPLLSSRIASSQRTLQLLTVEGFSVFQLLLSSQTAQLQRILAVSVEGLSVPSPLPLPSKTQFYGITPQTKKEMKFTSNMFKALSPLLLPMFRVGKQVSKERALLLRIFGKRAKSVLIRL